MWGWGPLGASSSANRPMSTTPPAPAPISPTRPPGIAARSPCSGLALAGSVGSVAAVDFAAGADVAAAGEGPAGAGAAAFDAADSIRAAVAAAMRSRWAAALARVASSSTEALLTRVASSSKGSSTGSGTSGASNSFSHSRIDCGRSVGRMPIAASTARRKGRLKPGHSRLASDSPNSPCRRSSTSGGFSPVMH